MEHIADIFKITDQNKQFQKKSNCRLIQWISSIYTNNNYANINFHPRLMSISLN